jgi:hypothetical protein
MYDFNESMLNKNVSLKQSKIIIKQTHNHPSPQERGWG